MTSRKVCENEQKRFEVRHMHCTLAGVVRQLSSHFGNDCFMMANVLAHALQAVMVDRVALM